MFEPRNQDDRIQLAILEELRELNKNIKKLVPNQEQTITTSDLKPGDVIAVETKKPSSRRKKEVK